MRALIRSLFPLLTLLAFACGPPATESFEPLFDGKSLTGWRIVGEQTGWEVRDGGLYTSGRGGGDLFTGKWYGNYILHIEWMLSPVGNSGIMVRSDTDSASGTGYEVQLLAPWTPYRDDLHCTASIYGHVPVRYRPDETTGVWRTMEITCDRKRVTISVDGSVCTYANIDSVASLRGKNLRGAIGLQGSHSDAEQWVLFRNLKVRDLDREPEYVLMGFDDPDPRLRQLAHEASVRIGGPIVDRLCTLTAWGDPMERSIAERALFDIAAAASSPAADKGYAGAALRALKREAKTADSETVRDYLQRLVDMIEA